MGETHHEYLTPTQKYIQDKRHMKRACRGSVEYEGMLKLLKKLCVIGTRYGIRAGKSAQETMEQETMEQFTKDNVSYVLCLKRYIQIHCTVVGESQYSAR